MTDRRRSPLATTTGLPRRGQRRGRHSGRTCASATRRRPGGRREVAGEPGDPPLRRALEDLRFGRGPGAWRRRRVRGRARDGRAPSPWSAAAGRRVCRGSRPGRRGRGEDDGSVELTGQADCFADRDPTRRRAVDGGDERAARPAFQPSGRETICGRSRADLRAHARWQRMAPPSGRDGLPARWRPRPTWESLGESTRRLRRARVLAAERARENRSVDDELRSLLDDRASAAANYAAAAAVVAVLALMVWQPS